MLLFINYHRRRDFIRLLTRLRRNRDFMSLRPSHIYNNHIIRTSTLS